MSRDPSATLSLAVFFQQSLAYLAVAITPDPLRGDPLSPEVQRVTSVVCLLRATAAEPETDVPETVPILAPGEHTPEQVRDRSGMAGTVWALMGVIGCVLGVLWAHLGGVL